MAAVAKASLNVKAAGLTKVITIEQADFKDFKQPGKPALMMMNPPYGERISTPDIFGTYRMIGETLKRQFKNNTAWVLSYRQECFDQIGLKPSIKIPLYNGSLECEFRKYQMFEGKFKEFRSEGNQIKTDEEKRAMAEKHRFKKNRDFKKRLDEEEENEQGDIRSFKFHSFARKDTENNHERRRDRFDREERDDRRTRKAEHPFRSKGKGFKRKNPKGFFDSRERDSYDD